MALMTPTSETSSTASSVFILVVGPLDIALQSGEWQVLIHQQITSQHTGLCLCLFSPSTFTWTLIEGTSDSYERVNKQLHTIKIER